MTVLALLRVYQECVPKPIICITNFLNSTQHSFLWITYQTVQETNIESVQFMIEF